MYEKKGIKTNQLICLFFLIYIVLLENFNRLLRKFILDIKKRQMDIFFITVS